LVLLLTGCCFGELGVEVGDHLWEEDAERVVEAVGEDLDEDGDHHHHPAPAAFRVVVLGEGEQLAEVGEEAVGRRPLFRRLAAAVGVAGGGRRPRVLEPRAGRAVLLQQQTVRQRVRAVEAAELGGAGHAGQTVLLVIQHHVPSSPRSTLFAPLAPNDSPLCLTILFLLFRISNLFRLFLLFYQALEFLLSQFKIH